MEKRFTVLILREPHKRVRQFKISGKLIIFGIFLLLFLFIASSIGIRSFILLEKEKKLTAILREETIFQKQQIKLLGKRVAALSHKMGKLAEFNRKLRIMVNLKDEEKQQYGIGGAIHTFKTKDYLSLESERSYLKQLHKTLDRLDLQIYTQEKYQSDLETIIKKQQDLLASTPSIWPTKGWVTSTFGYRISPFTGRREFHKGLDIATRRGTEIIAPAAGLITKIVRKRGLGLTLVIDHGHGIKTRYGHLSKVFVKKGDRVKRGDIIAAVGSTGRSTGPHLHYEVLVNGINVNPKRYILD